MVVEGLLFVGALLLLASGKKGASLGDTGEPYDPVSVVNGNSYADASNGDYSQPALSHKQQSILSAAQQIADEQTIGLHCFDFVHKIFTRAGYGGTPNNEAADLDFLWIGSQYADTYKRRTIQPRMFMTDGELEQLQPGDWLYIHNKNTYDAKGNHSIVFLGWIDKANRIAKTAEQRFSKRPGEIAKRDFRKHPVAHLMRVKP
jgi:hypothetical protein